MPYRSRNTLAEKLGTAFLRCEEANVLDAHRAAFTALFAGQSAALARDTTAGTLVESLAEATSECLRAFARS
jgi:NAD(P)H-dependent flavin oxidoreductase YrpB (nitropropane dioxygenase family)